MRDYNHLSGINLSMQPVVIVTAAIFNLSGRTAQSEHAQSAYVRTVLLVR